MTGKPTAALLIAGIGLIAALLLALPAQTVTSAYVNDVLIFLDGAHRVAMGQVPNRDFHTPLGPLVYYLPALGLWLSGRMGGALPVGMGLLIIAVVPIAVHVLTSRLRPILAVTFAAFLILVLAVPGNLGDPLSSLSFAMFYNRIGWVALALLAILYLHPPAGEDRLWRDAFSAAALVLIAIYTKITYAPVAFAILGLVLLDRRQRSWAAAAFGLVACGLLLVELAWRGSAAHVRDLVSTAQVSGEGSLRGLVQAALNNLSDLLVAGLLVGLALLRTRSLLDACFYGLCFAGGLLILSQNAHGWGIISIFAAAAVAAETTMRSAGGRAATGAALLFLVLVTAPIAKHTLALGTHAVLAATGRGAPIPLPRFGEVRFDPLWTPGDHGFTGLYIGTFSEGAELLQSLDNPPSRVLVLDFANPFSAGMGLEPPTGDLSWMHWGRNIGEEHHPEPEPLFANVDVVMIPAIGINSAQLSDLYEPYLAEHWDLARESTTWKLYVPRGEP